MKRKTINLISFVTILHFAISLYLLLNSLNFIFPGKLGFDPIDAERAVIFGKALYILGFPLFSQFLYPFGTLFSGFFVWVLLVLNSLLWGAAIYGLYKLFDLMRFGRLRSKSAGLRKEE